MKKLDLTPKARQEWLELKKDLEYLEKRYKEAGDIYTRRIR